MTRPIDPSRDLLFGLLALQNGLIDQVQLVAAFQSWTRDKSRPLAVHLVGRGDLDAEQRAGVEAMVALHLKKHGGDAENSLAAIPVGRATREKLAGLGDPQIDASLARVGSGSGSTETDDDFDRTPSYAVGTATSDGQRFRVLRPHARGGLGAVFVALDTELHREVALKQILDDHADDPTSRQRFLLEAEVTGGLEHPELPDVKSVSRRDVLLPVVPMFHANAWGMIYTAALIGSGLVLPGPKLDAVSVLDLLADERVTITAGVPTVWMAILEAIEAEPERWDLSALSHLIVGGSAAPPSMMERFDRFGLTIIHAWGMTETSPLGSVSRPPAELDDEPEAARLRYRARQGTASPFVEIRARNDDGELVAWDDQEMGELEVRGPWVARGYHRGQGAEKFTDDGWFVTGDVVTIDAGGNLKICDRSKDLVKSGGEWISSVDLENLLMAHPAVAEAAVIAIPDDRWGERPLAAVVLCDGASAEPDELRDHLAGEYAKWQIPDRFEFIDEIPRTATGKFKKTVLREMFVDEAEPTKA